MQVSHFHLFSLRPNDSPQAPFVTSSSLVMSSLSSSSDKLSSSSPNNHSMYQLKNAARLILPSSSLILRIVRRCSSSQYVLPSPSSTSLKFVPVRCSSQPPATDSKTSIAFCRSSSRSSRSSVSKDPPLSSSSDPSTSSQYHLINPERLTKPVCSGSRSSTCLSSSSP